MSAYAQSERHELVDLMARLGPDAPTLCAGWETADLAAHLVVRERRPGAAVGILVPPLAGATARAMAAERRRPWSELLEAVRSGPPAPLRPLDEPINLVEYFVHHEDVRRAGEGWRARALPSTMEAALWRRARTSARLLLRKAGVRVELEAPGFGIAAGGSGAGAVRVVGPPSELVMAVFGRLAATAVELEGDPAAVERLRAARLGL